MKESLQRLALPMAAAVISAFMLLFLGTFDSYSLAFITPETPFFNIVGFPFQRIEFISLLFALTLLVGVAIGMLLKRRVIKLVPFSIVMLGIIAVFIGIFDVDIMQRLLPTTRISHIIMTVSRFSGIVLGISGLFVGISAVALAGQSKYILHGIIAGGVLSIFAETAKAYNMTYFLIGVSIITFAVIMQYIKPIQGVEEKSCIFVKSDILEYASKFFIAGAAALIAVVGYVYFTATLNASVAVYILTIAVVAALYVCSKKIKLTYPLLIAEIVISLTLWIMALVLPDIALTVFALAATAVLLGIVNSGSENKKYSLLATSSGALVFTFIAAMLNHFLANVIKHSGNRVIYEVSELAWLVLIGVIAIVIVLSIFIKRCAKNSSKIEYIN